MSFRDSFGGSAKTVAIQMLEWQVLAQVLGALMTPMLQEIQRTVSEVSQTTPLTPAQLADMVVRNIVAHADAEAYAKQSGIAPSDFTRLVQSAGEPPSPSELIAALRRRIIPRDGLGPGELSFLQGIAEGRTYTKWAPVLEQLGDVPIGPADAVDAVVEGQISHEQGAAIAYLSGVGPENFQILVNTRGRPPSPTELGELLRRGLIPLEGTGPDVLSFQQGIFEGATKDKWWRMYAALSEYVPPPRTVTAMVREGSLTDDQALHLFRQSGLSAELASAYLVSAHHQRTQAERDLTVGTIKALFQDGLIAADQATQMLALLRYTAEDAAWLEDLWSFEQLQTKVRAAIAKVRSLYVAHKIDSTAASQALDGLGVPPAGRDEQLTVWTLERDLNVPQLTRAEIVDAWFFGVLTQAECDARLEQLGWSPEEAAILRGIRSHGKAPPAAAPAP